MDQAGLRVDAPQPGCLRTADLLGALSLAADLATGLPEEHAIRSCYLGMHIADRLQLPAEQRSALYYAELLMDAGCTAWTSHFATAILGEEVLARKDFFFFTSSKNPVEVVNWLRNYVAPGAPAHVRAGRALQFALHGKDASRDGFRNTCEVARRFAQRLGMPEEVQSALLAVFEQWDGSGPYGTPGELIPIISRIVYATSFLEAFHSVGGRPAAIRLAEKRRGKAFDPAIIDAFLSFREDDQFWAPLEQDSVWDIVLGMEPGSPYRWIKEETLEDVALAFADFADLKSFFTIGHSRRVGDLAEAVGSLMQLPRGEVAAIRQAALMHDVGLVTAPSFVLHKPRKALTPVEWESIRLHPYRGERILSRVSVLKPVVPLIAAHHERMDGRGYYRGLAGSQIPLGARIIAAADHFDDLSHETPDHPALELEDALKRLSDEAGRGLFPDTVEAIGQVVRGQRAIRGHRTKSQRGAWPAGLTDREVEILRLLTRGLSRREMAERLILSEHTVRHHLEHIYNKVGVSTRVAATLFAVEHDLLN